MRLSTRLTIAMVALVVLATTAVGVLTYRNVAALVSPRAMDRLQTHAELLGSELAASVRGARADVIGFRSAVAAIDIMNAHLNPGVNPAAAASEAELRKRLGRRFEAELLSKPNYHEFRYIGIADGGRELVRVDRSGPGGSPRTVPDDELRRKGDRPAFTETIRLPPGEVYVSPVELNQDDGVIETPHVPVLRVAIALQAPDGKPFGIVIINVDMRPAFTRIHDATGGRRTYVVNAQGDYLLHPDPIREFGFEFSKPMRIQDDLLQLGELPAAGTADARVVEDRTGHRFGAGMVSLRLADGPRVTVIETLLYTQLMATTFAVRDSSLIAGLAAVLCAVLLAFVVARSLTRPLVQMTRVVEGFSRGESVALPAGGGHEIGVLATAFAGMAEEARAKTAALRESEQMARDIVVNSLDAFIQTDEAGDILEWNPTAETIFGWSRQEVLGRQLLSLLLPAEVHSHRLKMRSELLRDEASAAAGERFEVEAIRKDGHPVKIEVSLKALRRSSGYVVNAFIRDMTQKIAADEQLRQAQKMEAVGQLTGGVAHDFNNVLTVITGTIEILASEVSDRPDLVAITRLISDAADRGAELTAHLLAFARKQPLQPRDTDVNRLIVEAAKLMRPTLGEHVEIESMLADAVWPALVDPGQLSSALLNLAINARDAMPQGGKLTLETRNVILDESYAAANSDVRAGNYVMIAVSDTGVGIPEAIRDRVFEPFFSTKEIGRGTGLGLSMVYGFVKQSDGHIKVYSEEGFGTTFKLYLPQAGGSPDLVTAETVSAQPEGGHETILVVEDDALVRSYVETQLKSLGYTTLSAANGAEALAIADGGAAFDLLFTDVIMPGRLNGRQLATEMAQRRPRLKVLFTSGYTENAIIHHGRLDSGVLLLAKPYRKVDLARMLRTALTDAGILADSQSPPGANH